MMFTVIILYSASKGVFDDEGLTMLLSIMAMLIDAMLIVTVMELLI